MSSILENNIQYLNKVIIPNWSDCSCSINNHVLTIKTKNGESHLKIPSKLVKHGGSLLILSNKSSLPFLKSLILHHHKKYIVVLRLKGSNYRFSIDSSLHLEVGKSHKTFFFIPKNISISRYLESKDSFVIKGLNAVDVNNYVFKLKLLKPVNCYTGSGLILNKEKVRLKQGKKK